MSSYEKKKKSSPPSADSVRLKNLKRYVQTCGLRKNYVKLFAECNSMSQKEKILERVLRKDTGFQGKISLIILDLVIYLVFLMIKVQNAWFSHS